MIFALKLRMFNNIVIINKNLHNIVAKTLSINNKSYKCRVNLRI